MGMSGIAPVLVARILRISRRHNNELDITGTIEILLTILKAVVILLVVVTWGHS